MKDAKQIVRCAIYTRKSTEEGLEQEFNSLMAQRESAEAYILSQREQSWQTVTELYDDGGFSGGNMDRPALKRLLEDVAAKRIDCIVVYKVDRLSRSLLDFASIIGILDKHNAAFVSVTQQFNTNTSLGRLTLNVLLSFAQFEREIISERTRDKVFAARRKGKWTGGHPTLGFDLVEGKLRVNEPEAKAVREIFATFVATGSLMKTLYKIDSSGWKTKSWVTRSKTLYGGNPFNRNTLAYLLANPIYIGKVRLKGELHNGEHPAVVEERLWQSAHGLLSANPRPSRAPKQPQDALLRGLLFCGTCGTPMVPTYTKRNSCRVPYYACVTAQKRGWKTCLTRLVPARLIEAEVMKRLSAYAEPPEALVARIQYHGGTRNVTMDMRGGTESRIVFALSQDAPQRRAGNEVPGRTPRLTRLMALAIRFEELLRAGTVKDYADLARLGRVTRARITQIMNLLNLAPDLQERLLFLPRTLAWRDEISERTLRDVASETCWNRQRSRFAAKWPEGQAQAEAQR